MEQHDMLKVSDVARELGVHRTTVGLWIRNGLFPNARKVGPGENSPYRIPREDVEEFKRKFVHEAA